MRCGVDTGGTFTDLVTDDGRIVKVLSTSTDPSEGVKKALAAGGGDGDERVALLAHGTTIATNALLERRGARVALVTTTGFADVIEIARQDRPSLYDPFADRPQPLVPRNLRYEVDGRLDGSGAEVAPVGPVPDVAADVEAVAVCLLHADLNPAHERTVADAWADRHDRIDVTCSSEVSPEFREYERTVTTVVNAYVGPRVRPYLRVLADLADDVLVMTSAGGLIPPEEARRLSVALLLSGPAGGVVAAAAAAESAGFRDAVTFDMGGTSTDVCLVRGGRAEPAAQRTAAGFPIRLPALDIHTIGAGGGSLARLDAGAALVVGPESAGADPGPACYGRGGTEPTVTDADLVLGRIPADTAFSGLDGLDTAAAEAALVKAGLDAEGVVKVVDAAMVEAVRAVTVERGVDPSELALVAFGGAGPLHACGVADALDMRAVIVPPRAGVLSAVGLLCAPRQRDLVRSWASPSDHTGIAEAVADLAAEAEDAVAGTEPASTSGIDVEVTTTLDCRYAGQSHELTVPDVDAFHEAHRDRNGYARPGAPVEVVALRARARIESSLDPLTLGPPPQDRSAATGPAVVAEADCTVWIPAGWSAEVGSDGSWIIRRDEAGTDT